MRLQRLASTIALSVCLAAFQAGRAADAASERARAWDALRSRLQDEKYLSHSRAVEAIMREMAAPKTDDAEEWGLAGLLHDIDIGETAEDLGRHGVVGARILRDLGFSGAVVHAVNAHDDRAGVARTSRLDHALYCADQVYWLIRSTGMDVPSDKLNAAVPEAIWEQVQEMPSKKAVVGEASNECAEIGLSMPQAFAAAQAASRKLSPARANRD